MPGTKVHSWQADLFDDANPTPIDNVEVEDDDNEKERHVDARQSSLFGEPEPGWKKLWTGMPTFAQKDLTPYKSITVHFKDPEDQREFAELTGQTPGTNTALAVDSSLTNLPAGVAGSIETGHICITYLSSSRSISFQSICSTKARLNDRTLNAPVFM